jgi:hypothetical protein
MKGNASASQTLAKLFLLFLFTAFATGLSAQVKLSVQGLLKKGDGTSLPDGNYTMKFNFYDATNNSLVASVTTNDVAVSGGVYSALLDVSTSSPANALTFSTEYVVGLQVNGGTEMTPRINLTAAPYALALNGISNVFPTQGLVKADAIDVVGAVSAASYGAVNATTVTASGAVNAASVTASGAVNAASVTASGAVNAASVTASGAVNAASVTASGAVNAASVTASGAVNAASVTASGAVNAASVNAASVTASGAVNAGSMTVTGSGGYTFTNDNDSGLFSGGDGTFSIKANGQGIAFGNVSGFNIEKPLFLFNVPNNYDGDNLEWRGLKNPAGYQVGINTSSRRYKTNIKPFDTDFTKILQLQPRIYNRKDNDPNTFEIGYIAEEADSLGMKNLVLYDDQNRPNSLIYKKFVLYTNEVVKMHHADIAQLKAEVAALTAEKNALRTENASLRADAQSQQANFSKQMDELSRRLRSLEVAAGNR